MKEAFKWPLRQDEGCRFQKSPTAHCPTYREYGDLSIGDVFSPALVTALVPLYFIHFKYNLFSAWQSGGAALRKMKGPTSAWDTAAWVRVTMWRAAATWHVTERDTGHTGELIIHWGGKMWSKKQVSLRTRNRQHHDSDTPRLLESSWETHETIASRILQIKRMS